MHKLHEKDPFQIAKLYWNNSEQKIEPPKDQLKSLLGVDGFIYNKMRFGSSSQKKLKPLL